MITVLVLMTFVDENGLHKAGSITKVKEDDFNPSYMKKIDVPSGSSSLEDLTDVDIASVEDGQIIKYDAATQKWVNVTGGDGGSTITDIYTDTNTGNVSSMEIDGTEYEFGAGETTIENISLSSTGSYVQSMDIDSDSCTFSTVENVQPAYDSDILASVDLNGNSYKLFYLDNFQYNSENYVTSFDDGDSNTYGFCDVGNVQTDSNDLVETIDINGTTYNFSTALPLENLQQSQTGKLASFDYGSDTVEIPSELADLEDISVSGASDGDVLTYDSQHGVWEATTPSGGADELDDLSDVDTTGATNGQVLTYDSSSTKWVPTTPSGGGGDAYRDYTYDATQTQGAQIYWSDGMMWADLATAASQSTIPGNLGSFFAQTTPTTSGTGAIKDTRKFIFTFGAGSPNIVGKVLSMYDTNTNGSNVGSVYFSVMLGPDAGTQFATYLATLQIIPVTGAVTIARVRQIA